MRIDKLAMTSREALQNAIGIASDAQAASVEPIHLLAALLTGGERNISVIIERIGADPKQLASATQQAIDRAPKVEGAQQQLGSDLTRVLERAEKKASKMDDNFVVTEHLLMALAEDKGEAGRILAAAARPASASRRSIRAPRRRPRDFGGLEDRVRGPRAVWSQHL